MGREGRGDEKRRRRGRDSMGNRHKFFSLPVVGILESSPDLFFSLSFSVLFGNVDKREEG